MKSPFEKPARPTLTTLLGLTLCAALLVGCNNSGNQENDTWVRADGASDAELGEGSWEECCNNREITTCYCPAGVDCGYGDFTHCGGNACVVPPTTCGSSDAGDTSTIPDTSDAGDTGQAPDTAVSDTGPTDDTSESPDTSMPEDTSSPPDTSSPTDTSPSNDTAPDTSPANDTTGGDADDATSSDGG